MRLRVVSWNVHSWVGTDRRNDPERVAAVLAGLDADVIGLQEVDWRTAEADGPDPFERLAEHVGMTAIPGPCLADHRGEYGNGLLTRLPVEAVERLDLSHPDREPRGAIDARLRHEGHPIRVLVTHLGLDRRERGAQLRRLAERLGPGPEPTSHVGEEREEPRMEGGTGEGEEQVRLLLGDLNEWLPARRIHAPLVPQHFARGYSARSFPTRLPLLHLDRILVDPEPARATLRVHREGVARRASDHLPLVLDAHWGLDPT